MRISSINMYSFKGRIKKGDIANKTNETKNVVKLDLCDNTTTTINKTTNSELKTDAVTAGAILIAIPVAGTIGAISELNP